MSSVLAWRSASAARGRACTGDPATAGAPAPLLAGNGLLEGSARSAAGSLVELRLLLLQAEGKRPIKQQPGLDELGCMGQRQNEHRDDAR